MITSSGSPAPDLPVVEHELAAGEGPMVKADPDFEVPAVIAGKVRASEYPGMTFSLRLTWNSTEARYVITHLAITAEEGITTPDVRAISLPKLHLYLARGRVLLRAADGYAKFEDILNHEQFRIDLDRIQAAGRMDEESLTWVTRIYEWARITGQNPNSTVMLTMNLPQRTATRWIARARAEGLLATR